MRGGAPDDRTSTGIAGAPALAPYTGFPSRPGPQLRSGPRKIWGENRVQRPGAPRVPPPGPIAPSAGFPSRLRTVLTGPARPGPARPDREAGGKTKDAWQGRTDKRPTGPQSPGGGPGRSPRSGGRWEGRKAPAGAGRPVRAAPHPGSLPGSAAATPPYTRRFNLRQVHQPPAPRRQRDDHANVAGLLELRPGDRGRIASLADVADAPEGKRYIKAAARWRPTTDRNVSGDSSRSRGREGAQPAARPPDLVPAHSGCRLSVPGRRRASASGAPGRPARRDPGSPRDTRKMHRGAPGWLSRLSGRLQLRS